MIDPKLDELLKNIVNGLNKHQEHLEVLGKRTLDNEKVIQEAFNHIAARFIAIESSIGDLYLTGQKKEDK